MQSLKLRNWGPNASESALFFQQNLKLETAIPAGTRYTPKSSKFSRNAAMRARSGM